MCPVSSLTVEDLVAIGRRPRTVTSCPACAALVCPGWESMPGGFAASALECIGTLRETAIEDPTVAEYHPDGTNNWSADAPIAPDYFPYNRCDVWACKACRRSFLRYTEYGGYYVDERIRELNPTLVRGA